MCHNPFNRCSSCSLQEDFFNAMTLNEMGERLSREQKELLMKYEEQPLPKCKLAPDQRHPEIKIHLEAHGAIAAIQDMHSHMQCGYGKTIADAISNLYCKLGIWQPGN